MFTDTGQDWMWGTCTAGQGFFCGEKLQYCAKEMKEKFAKISEFWWISMIKLRSFVSDKKAGKISVHHSIVLMSAKILQTRWWIKTKFCGIMNFMPAAGNFVSLKQSFAFLKGNFILAKQNIVSWKGIFVQDWVENCSIGQSCHVK